MCSRLTLAPQRSSLSAAEDSAEVGRRVRAAVVDDDLEAVDPSCSSRDKDLGQIEVVGDDADLSRLVGDRRVEEVEDLLARLEAHPLDTPGRCSGSLGTGSRGPGRRSPATAPGSACCHLVVVHERLRRDEAAREAHVHGTRVGVAAEDDPGCLLSRRSSACRRVHQHRRDPVVEGYLRSSALNGKCTQRNFWNGASSEGNVFCPVPWLWSSVKFRRFFSGCQIVEFGSWYSMAKPTNSAGGVPSSSSSRAAPCAPRAGLSA